MAKRTVPKAPEPRVFPIVYSLEIGIVFEEIKFDLESLRLSWSAGFIDILYIMLLYVDLF